MLVSLTLRRNRIKILERFNTQLAPGIRRFLRDEFWKPPPTHLNSIEERLSADSAFSRYKDVVVSGETENISVYIMGNEDIIVYSPFQRYKENEVLLMSRKILAKQCDHICLIERTKEIAERLSLPKILLINPSITDVFPTPRFALSVAVIAGYLRKHQKADVSIVDMQVGPTIETIIEEIRRLRPDIIGVSISFGQASLTTSILERIFSDEEIMSRKPIVVAGNVIAAFGYEEMINKFPDLIVCTNEGELSMIGLADYAKGKIDLEMVPGITYLDKGVVKKTPQIEVDMNDVPLPATDTVEEIIKQNGALTMEISRGCSHSACSFCPRTHKSRKWKGMSPKNALKQLEYYGRIFDHFGTKRRIFMADEEFIGWMGNHKEAKRIIDIAQGMINMDLRIHFETNTRVDQIYNSCRDKSWHVERMKMLTLCREAGLDRLLVGIESGSDSVLKRFNKGISAQDSVMAIRILTALGIGLRATFIMFDPLMNFSELEENVAFLERRDIYLRPVNLSEISYSRLFDGIHNNDFVRANSTNTPLHEHIAYMLVLLEVLMNCNYIQLLKVAEIESGRSLFLNSKEPDINMARYKVGYLDKRIGDIAISCQQWIDRHFALDYFLKGMYKAADTAERVTIFGYRAKYRELSFHLLKSLIWIFDKESTTKINGNVVSENELIPLREKARVESWDNVTMATLELFNEKMRLLVDGIDNAVDAGKITDKNDRLKKVIKQWQKKSDWSLINP